MAITAKNSEEPAMASRPGGGRRGEDTRPLYLCHSGFAMGETDPDEPERPALDSEGRLTGRLRRLEPAPEPLASPPDEAPLELEERPRAVKTLPLQQFRDEPLPPARRRGLWLALGALALGAGLFGASLLLGPAAWRQLPAGVVSPPRRGTVLVQSEPAGATVRIAGQVVGATPFAGDNRWGDAEVTVSLPGYAPWKGALVAGREEQRLSARLRER
jgi:hypothetical protein